LLPCAGAVRARPMRPEPIAGNGNAFRGPCLHAMVARPLPRWTPLAQAPGACRACHPSTLEPDMTEPRIPPSPNDEAPLRRWDAAILGPVFYPTALLILVLVTASFAAPE